MTDITPVALAHTPFKQKFGVPRQSNLVGVKASLELLPPFDSAEAVAGLESCSHLWLIFQFDRNPPSTAVRVRPPRLGGNDKMGVFATRSSFRPNGLGLTLVALDQVVCDTKVLLEVSGIDLVDQTPIVDIKPYLPYVDCVPQAVNGFAPASPQPSLAVVWSHSATWALSSGLSASSYTEAQLFGWITDLVALDPRPAYKKRDDDKVYHMQFDQFDVHFCVDEETATILALHLLTIS